MIGPRWPNQRRLESSRPFPPSLLSTVNMPLTPAATHGQPPATFPLQPAAPPPISLSPSLLLFLPRSLSLRCAMALLTIHSNGGSTEDTCRLVSFRGLRSGGSQPLGRSIAVVYGSVRHVGSRGENNGETQVSGHL